MRGAFACLRTITDARVLGCAERRAGRELIVSPGGGREPIGSVLESAWGSAAAAGGEGWAVELAVAAVGWPTAPHPVTSSARSTTALAPHRAGTDDTTRCS